MAYVRFTDEWTFTSNAPDRAPFTCKVTLDIMPSGAVYASTLDSDGQVIHSAAGLLETFTYRDRYGHVKEGYYVHMGHATLDRERRTRHAAYRLADYVIRRSIP